MKTINRELSWLSFNDRVLQEALDPTVPLVERMRFLGIYSNNMDEFFRVRVANLRRLQDLKNVRIEGFKGGPNQLYLAIRKEIVKQQKRFESCYAEIKILLEKEGIFIVNEKTVSADYRENLDHYFHEELKHAIFPILLDLKRDLPKLRDDSIYLGVQLKTKIKKHVALLQIPSEYKRFYQLNGSKRTEVILIDDIIRLYLHEIFSILDPIECHAYTFKFTRDAELDLDDDLSLSYLEKMEKSLKQRKKGKPVRFVYDEEMPADLLRFLLQKLELKKGVNSLSGGRYHNFKDFMSFPDFGRIDFCFQELKANLHPDLASQHSLIHSIQKKDILLHFPYQQFDHIVDLLREASLDPKVKSIHINIYRVARHSEVMNALLACVFNGKEVNVVFELQARFDEENNMNWSNRLKEIGANVIYGMPQLKIHSKLLQIKRIENKKIHYISYIGTGNFNERTSQVYTDLALMTAHREIAHEVARVFKLIENSLERQTFKHLMVSPFNTRKKIMALIEREIKHARLSKPAAIKIKINNLTDSRLIDKLYKASQAGVQIQLIVRGICCLKPGVKGLSDNITAISIVDRFLEHARFFSFHNNGNTVYYLTSADWMERNLDQRIEVGVEVLDRAICEELKLIFDYQWRGSVKARSLSADLANNYAQRHLTPFHAQKELLNFYTEKLEKVTQ